jgi:hypothetical protein
MKYNITKEQTNIDGLAYLPKLVDYSMDADGAPCGDPFYGSPPNEVSDAERSELEKIVLPLRDIPINIMEIGINRNGPRSFTHILLNKHADAKYLGIDIDDRSSLNNPTLNINTLRTDSSNQDLVRNTLNNLGMKQLSILFIDGWHSVNMCINDWKYSDLVVPGGYVIFHDVHMHPGPNVFMDAIDPTKYSVSVPLKNQPGHYGIGIAKKL